MSNKRTWFQFTEIVFIKLFGAEIFIERYRFGMDLTTVPNKLDCVFLSIQLIERNIRNGKSVAHGQFGESYVILLLLGQFGLVETGAGKLRKVVVDIFCFWLLFGVKP